MSQQRQGFSATQRWLITGAAVVFLALVAIAVAAFLVGQRDTARVQHQQDQELVNKQNDCHARAASRAQDNARFIRAGQLDATTAHYYDLCMAGELPP